MTHHNVMKDKDYDLVSSLYHALQGVQASSGYIADAEKSNDEEAVKFLKEAQERYGEIARNAKALLAQRMG